MKNFEVYKELVDSGTIKGMRGKVFLALAEKGKCTRNELAQHMNLAINSVTGRIKELIDMKYVGETETRRADKVTGKNNHEVYVL